MRTGLPASTTDFADDNYVHGIDGHFTLSDKETLEYNHNESMGNFDPALYEDGYITRSEYDNIESDVKSALEDAVDSYDTSEHADLV